MISIIIGVVKRKLLSIIIKIEVLLLKKGNKSRNMLEKKIQEQKLKIKKKDTGKIENLANFNSSDIFVFF